MFETRNHTIWVEKYRPDTLEGYIGNEHIKTKLTEYIKTQDVPHLLFVGKAGTGKTTAAKILVKHIDSDVLFLNASDENNIETARTKIRGFVSTMSWKPLKLVVLDEFDGFTRQGQEALRNMMEQFSLTARFILTANYIERVIDPIVSRTQQFTVVPPSKIDVAKHVYNIVRMENIFVQATDIKTLVDAYYPDIRKVIGEAQNSVRDGKLVIDEKQLVESDVKLKILEELKHPIKSNFTTIRQLVADARMRDFSDLYRLLFDRTTDYAPNHIPAVILALSEGQYRDALVLDKEINFMATIINILEVINEA